MQAETKPASFLVSDYGMLLNMIRKSFYATVRRAITSKICLLNYGRCWPRNCAPPAM